MGQFLKSLSLFNLRSKLFPSFNLAECLPRAKAEQHREEMAAKFAEMEERLRAREGDLQEAQANIR